MTNYTFRGFQDKGVKKGYRFFLGLIAGCAILETILFIQTFLVLGAIREPMFVSGFLSGYPFFLVLAFPLFVYLAPYSVPIWLVLEIPWVAALVICHVKKENWSAGKLIIIYTGVIGLAALPVVSIQLLGVPQIPLLTDNVFDYITSFEHSYFSGLVTPVQLLQLYLVFTKWLISWGYLVVIYIQNKTSTADERCSKLLQKTWIAWIILLTIFLCINPAYMLMYFINLN